MIVGTFVLPILLGPVAYMHGMAMRAEARNRQLITQDDAVADSAGGSLIRVGQIIFASCAAFGTLWFAGLLVAALFAVAGVRIRPSVAASLSAGLLIALTALYYRLLTS